MSSYRVLHSILRLLRLKLSSGAQFVELSFKHHFLISHSSIEKASPGNILTRVLLVGYSVVTSTGAASFESDIHPVS